MSVGLDDGLRGEVAASRGLDVRAAALLTGESVEELEHSADALAQLLGTGDPGDQAATTGADLFGNRAAAKAERQARILRLFAGPPTPEPQPRDASGRYASFDGGARPATLTSQQPESHGELILRAARASKRGQSGF